MTLEISKVKKVILTWVYNTLNEKFPTYFNSNDYINISGVLVKNSPNVYWADTLRDRPLDATECYLSIDNDASPSIGSDGEFIYNESTQKFYIKVTEPHELTVTFAISSTKNEKLGLSALQAQNLTYSACTYLKAMLKSGSTSDYFAFK